MTYNDIIGHRALGLVKTIQNNHVIPIFSKRFSLLYMPGTFLHHTGKLL